ncbi:zinc finger Y-chromosomal protein-like [Lycorma delicatula]|uniref:zinc finger Y-chromosomal protein-like n=1 Tax=Lycorma delicatula TaxID=130591 RepID=UPI003F514E9B
MESDNLDIKPKVKNDIKCETMKNEVHEKLEPPELNDTDVEAAKKEENINSDDDWEEEFEDEEEEENESSDDDDINASNQLYFCRICWQHFRYKIPLKRHMQRIHQKEKPPVYTCKPCKIGLYTPRKFSEHFKSCPFGYLQKKLFTCQQCGKVFAIQKHLNQHEEAAHNQPKQSFACSLCGKEFRKQKILTHHTSMHKELWQSCKICKRPFRKAQDLKKHILTHDNRIPYFCKKCKEGFLEKNQFKKHKKQFHKGKNNRNKNERDYGNDKKEIWMDV